MVVDLRADLQFRKQIQPGENTTTTRSVPAIPATDVSGVLRTTVRFYPALHSWFTEIGRHWSAFASYPGTFTTTTTMSRS